MGNYPPKDSTGLEEKHSIANCSKVELVLDTHQTRPNTTGRDPNLSFSQIQWSEDQYDQWPKIPH